VKFYVFMYEGVSKSFRTESIKKYILTFGITRSSPLQRVMEAKLTRLTHKIAIQLHIMAESCTICSSRSRRQVRKLLDTPSYAYSNSHNYLVLGNLNSRLSLSFSRRLLQKRHQNWKNCSRDYI